MRKEQIITTNNNQMEEKGMTFCLYRIPVRRFSKRQKKKKARSGFFPKTQQTQRETPDSLNSSHLRQQERRGNAGVRGASCPPAGVKGAGPLAAGGVSSKRNCHEAV